MVHFWLSVLQKKSETLCEVVGGKLLPYLKEGGHIRLIQCFLNPDLMLQREELPSSLRDSAEQTRAGGQQTRAGGHQPAQRDIVKVDPLYQLLVPNDPERKGQSPALRLLVQTVTPTLPYWPQ